MSEPAIATGALSAPGPVLSVSPLVLSAPGRAVDLQVRVSAPVTGSAPDPARSGGPNPSKLRRISGHEQPVRWQAKR
jgi:hypothetical protein